MLGGRCPGAPPCLTTLVYTVTFPVFALANPPSQDPALSHFLPLEHFDNAELDLFTPEEWVARGGGEYGTPARSKFHLNDDQADWAACYVQEYNEESNEFLVHWKQSGKKVCL